MFEIDDINLNGFGGVTAGLQTEERWQYPAAGYNAQDGKFYIGEDEAATLEIIPFAMRQCKEVTDAAGVIHRYPIKTARNEMIEGEPKSRIQVVGLINGELHVFGARSWTARAAWVNPLSGQFHDAQFEGGFWPRLLKYIKEIRIRRGIVTAPLCYTLSLAVGNAINVASAANAKQRSKTYPIVATAVTFVGAEQAEANARLYAEEALDEWVAEWNRGDIPAEGDAGGHEPPPPTSDNNHTDDPGHADPLAAAIMAIPNANLAFSSAASATRFIAFLTADSLRDDNRILEAADRIISAYADGAKDKDAAGAALTWYKSTSRSRAIDDDLFGPEYDARQEQLKAAGLATAQGRNS